MVHCRVVCVCIQCYILVWYDQKHLHRHTVLTEMLTELLCVPLLWTGNAFIWSPLHITGILMCVCMYLCVCIVGFVANICLIRDEIYDLDLTNGK